MKKLLLILFSPALLLADRLGSLRSSADVLLTTQTVSGVATSSSNTWTAAQTFNSTMSVNTSGAAIQSLKITNSGISGTEIGVNGTANGVGTGLRFGLYGWGSGGDNNYALYLDSGVARLANIANSVLATDVNGIIISTTITGGSGSGSIQTAVGSQLLDMQVTRTSASVLTICATCSATVPVNTGIAGTIYTFNSSATITLGAVTGTVRIYITDGSDGGTVGTIQVRYTGSSGVTCNTGCVVQNSQSSFPTSGGIIPLAQWTATSSGVWDATDSTGVGLRPFLSGTGNFVAGAGMVFTAPRTFSVDPTQVLMIGTTDYGTYGSSGTITFTSSLKNMGAVTLTSSATINGPTSPTDGQKFVFRITQDAAGSRTVTWATGAGNFSFSTDIPSLTMSTAASAVDYVGAIYSSAKNRWHIVSKSFGS